MKALICFGYAVLVVLGTLFFLGCVFPDIPFDPSPIPDIFVTTTTTTTSTTTTTQPPPPGPNATLTCRYTPTDLTIDGKADIYPLLFSRHWCTPEQQPKEGGERPEKAELLCGSMAYPLKGQGSSWWCDKIPVRLCTEPTTFAFTLKGVKFLYVINNPNVVSQVNPL